MTVQTQTYPLTDANDNAPVLRRALITNAIFSLISGLLFVLDAAAISEFLGIHDMRFFKLMYGTGLIRELGIGILIFAGVVGFIATRRPIRKQAGVSIFIGDCVWVAGSILLIVTKALPLTTAGFWAVLVVTDIVLAFAVWEFIGVRRMRA